MGEVQNSRLIREAHASLRPSVSPTTADQPILRSSGLPTRTSVGVSDAVERVTRIELAFSAWEADVLPLNYTREERRA